MARASEMSFWDHLDALRGTLIHMCVILAACFCIAFYFTPMLFNKVILAPCSHTFFIYHLFPQKNDVKLININLTDQFMTHMNTAFWIALIVCAPLLLWQLWLFIRPALYPKERNYVMTAFGMGMILFYIGVAVSYFFVFPITLRFLINYDLSDQIINTLSFGSYISNFMMMMLVMGLVFEMPLVTWLLAMFGIIKKWMLKKYQRHAIVAIFVVAAVITPTGDPFTLTIVALPLVLLYELSILVIKDKKEDT